MCASISQPGLDELADAGRPDPPHGWGFRELEIEDAGPAARLRSGSAFLTWLRSPSSNEKTIGFGGSFFDPRQESKTCWSVTAW